MCSGSSILVAASVGLFFLVAVLNFKPNVGRQQVQVSVSGNVWPIARSKQGGVLSH